MKTSVETIAPIHKARMNANGAAVGIQASIPYIDDPELLRQIAADLQPIYEMAKIARTEHNPCKKAKAVEDISNAVVTESHTVMSRSVERDDQWRYDPQERRMMRAIGYNFS